MSTVVGTSKGSIVEWAGEDRIIPKYGHAAKGEQIFLPESMAESFIKQGLAIVPKKRKPKED